MKMRHVTYASTLPMPSATTGAARLAEEKAATRATDIFAKCILVVQAVQFFGFVPCDGIGFN